ncbi:MAG: hypothetical protein LBB23_02580 [Rickettsiales bacterium]|nr:hypothetical protein [Rickettsiales bacterium]
MGKLPPPVRQSRTPAPENPTSRTKFAGTPGGGRKKGSNHPVRLRFATARHPFASEGDFGENAKGGELKKANYNLRFPPSRE